MENGHFFFIESSSSLQNYMVSIILRSEISLNYLMLDALREITPYNKSYNWTILWNGWLQHHIDFHDISISNLFEFYGI